MSIYKGKFISIYFIHYCWVAKQVKSFLNEECSYSNETEDEEKTKKKLLFGRTKIKTRLGSFVQIRFSTNGEILPDILCIFWETFLQKPEFTVSTNSFETIVLSGAAFWKEIFVYCLQKARNFGAVSLSDNTPNGG